MNRAEHIYRIDALLEEKLRSLRQLQAALTVRCKARDCLPIPASMVISSDRVRLIQRSDP
jgi:hypothetical protein